MRRLFIRLYLVIIVGLIAIGWCLDKIWESQEGAVDATHTPHHQILELIEFQLRGKTSEDIEPLIENLKVQHNLNIDLFDLEDISGEPIKTSLESNQVSAMETSAKATLLMKKIQGSPHVVALTFFDEPDPSKIGWILTLAFYAGIGLVLMIWIWPLSRDLKILEVATQKLGVNKKASINNIKNTSQIYPLADSFNRMQQRIDKLIESHKLLSNAIAHELKTPLARMKFEIAAGLKARDCGNHNQLHDIERNVDEMNALISAILDYASMERKDVQIELASHDMDELIRSVINSDEVDKNNFRVNFSMPGNPIATCDAYLIERAIRNLYYNAIKYAKGEISLSFEQVNGINTFAIDDDGTGISEQDKTKVFDSFYRATQTDQEVEGFGLGLAIVRSIMEWHDGSVEVQDSELGGARFIMHWPEKASITHRR